MAEDPEKPKQKPKEASDPLLLAAFYKKTRDFLSKLADDVKSSPIIQIAFLKVYGKEGELDASGNREQKLETGTVFYIGNGCWLTSKHTLKTLDAGKMYISFPGQKTPYGIESIKVHPTLDIAIVKTAARPEKMCFELNALGKSDKQHYIYGYTATNEAIFTATGLVQPSGDKLEGFSAPGMSGAPIFDSSGRVIGVLSGGGNLPNTHITAFTPISQVMDFLNAETR